MDSLSQTCFPSPLFSSHHSDHRVFLYLCLAVWWAHSKGSVDCHSSQLTQRPGFKAAATLHPSPAQSLLPLAFPARTLQTPPVGWLFSSPFPCTALLSHCFGVRGSDRHQISPACCPAVLGYSGIQFPGLQVALGLTSSDLFVGGLCSERQ